MAKTTTERLAGTAAAEVAGANREFAQHGAAMANNVADKTTAAVEETNRAAGEVYSAATSGTADFHRQWIEMARTNTNATLDFANQLIDVRSPSDFFDLSTVHARKRLEIFAEQAQQLTGLVQKMTADAAAPLQAGAKRVFSKTP